MNTVQTEQLDLLREVGERLELPGELFEQKEKKARLWPLVMAGLLRYTFVGSPQLIVELTPAGSKLNEKKATLRKELMDELEAIHKAGTVTLSHDAIDSERHKLRADLSRMKLIEIRGEGSPIAIYEPTETGKAHLER